MSLSFGTPAPPKLARRAPAQHGPKAPNRRGYNDRYSLKEDAILREFYSREPLCAIALRLDRSIASVQQRSQRLVDAGLLDRGTRFYNPSWTPAETDLLIDKRGDLTDAELGRRIGRSGSAVHNRAYLLHRGYRDNFLSANQVALILGIDIHKVVRLGERGILRLRRSKVPVGPHQVWRCEIEDFERFLRTQSAWYDWRRIQEEPWRGMARKAHADPWLGTPQVAAMAGTSRDWVQRNIRAGKLAATQVFGTGGHLVYRVRKSEAQRWIARPLLKPSPRNRRSA